MISKRLMIVLLSIAIHAYAADDKKKELNRQLFNAIKKNGSIEEIIHLIIEGADVNANEYGFLDDTPCHVAVVYRKDDCIKTLYKKGADINAKNIYGATPLHHAATYNQLHAVKELYECGANIQEKNNDGDTPKERAQEYGHEDIAKLLEEYENLLDIKEPEDN